MMLMSMCQLDGKIMKRSTDAMCSYSEPFYMMEKHEGEEETIDPQPSFTFQKHFIESYTTL